MRRNTHNKIAKTLFPEASNKKINQINHVIDNPDELSKLISSFTNTIFDVGINKKGMAKHRNVNHDLLSAIITGYRYGGEEGVGIALTHLISDLASDKLYKLKIRDIVEAMINGK